MTHITKTNAVTRAVGQPDLSYRDQVVRLLATVRDVTPDLDLAAAISQVQSDFVYLDRIVAGHEDTSMYLDSMATEFSDQAQASYDAANDESDLDDIVRARVAAIRADAKAEAYQDALRVLNIPFEVALRQEEAAA